MHKPTCVLNDYKHFPPLRLRRAYSLTSLSLRPDSEVREVGGKLRK